MKFILFKDKKGEFRFKLVSGNNKTVAIGESYKEKRDVLHIVKRINPSFPVIDKTDKVKKRSFREKAEAEHAGSEPMGEILDI